MMFQIVDIPSYALNSARRLDAGVSKKIGTSTAILVILHWIAKQDTCVKFIAF